MHTLVNDLLTFSNVSAVLLSVAIVPLRALVSCGAAWMILFQVRL
jgi:hypothetical protein